MRPFPSDIRGIEAIDSEGWVIRRVAQQVAEPLSPVLGIESMCRWLVGTFTNFSIGHMIHLIVCRDCEFKLSILHVSGLLRGHDSDPYRRKGSTSAL